MVRAPCLRVCLGLASAHSDVPPVRRLPACQLLIEFHSRLHKTGYEAKAQTLLSLQVGTVHAAPWLARGRTRPPEQNDGPWVPPPRPSMLLSARTAAP